MIWSGLLCKKWISSSEKGEKIYVVAPVVRPLSSKTTCSPARREGQQPARQGIFDRERRGVVFGEERIGPVDDGRGDGHLSGGGFDRDVGFEIGIAEPKIYGFQLVFEHGFFIAQLELMPLDVARRRKT